jgi:D-threo-aldose 1-dehydrogenase
METRQVGNAHVSAVGFGAGPLGGFRGPISAAQAENALRAYWDHDGRYVDTSPFYGYGRSEMRVGAFAGEHPGIAISTKIGRVLRPLTSDDDTSQLRKGGLPFWPSFDYSYDGAMRSLEQSCLRTGLIRFDIVLIHDLDVGYHGKEFERLFDSCMNGAYRALRELRDAGDIKAIGVGVNETAVAKAFIEAGAFDCVMLAGRYTLLNHDDGVVSLFDSCVRSNVGILAAGVFNSGILATGATEAASYDYRPAPPERRARVAEIEAVCAQFGVPLPAAAIQFVQAHPAVASVVLGSMSADEVRQNVAHSRHAIPQAFWQSLAEHGILPRELLPPRIKSQE